MTGQIASVILAGGQARRLGGADKTLLDLGGQPILTRIIAALGLANIAISANGDPVRFAAFGRPVLSDGIFVNQGPLAGVLAGLDWAAAIGASELLTVPGDTPFIPRGLEQTLSPAPARARSGGRSHHLVALWPIACRGALRRLLDSTGLSLTAQTADSVPHRHGPEGARGTSIARVAGIAAGRTLSVAAFAASLGMKDVDFAAGTWDLFFNVNSLDDLAKARDIIKTAAPPMSAAAGAGAPGTGPP